MAFSFDCSLLGFGSFDALVSSLLSSIRGSMSLAAASFAETLAGSPWAEALAELSLAESSLAESSLVEFSLSEASKAEVSSDSSCALMGQLTAASSAPLVLASFLKKCLLLFCYLLLSDHLFLYF